MKDYIYLWLDLIDYGIRGYCLAYLLRDLVKNRLHIGNEKVSHAIILLQFLMVQMFLNHSNFVKQFLYGSDRAPGSSEPSIVIIVVSLFFTLITCVILYKGNQIRTLYLVITFYSMLELVRFALYSLSVNILNLWMNFYIHQLKIGELSSGSQFESITNRTEIIWNLSTTFLTVAVLYLCVKRYKKYIVIKDYQLKSTEMVFLIVPSAIGLILSILLRCILYDQQGTEMHALLSDHPEMNYIVPVISVLCMMSILLSARVLRKLVENHERQLKLEIYQNQISDMEKHMIDVEHLYDGIRGMKHDMKNHIANMGALLGDDITGEAVLELKEYMGKLAASMEELDMKYQTGNPVTDVIVNRYARYAKKMEINFACDFLFPGKHSISAFDLSILLNNSLENSIEACGKMTQGMKFIKVHSYCRGNMFFFEVQNSFGEPVQHFDRDGMPGTTKEDGGMHGLGMKNIRNTAEKYYGRMEFGMQDHTFYLTVMMQGREPFIT